MREREKRALWLLCVEAQRKKKRDYEEVRNRNFVTSFTEYNINKVLVDVATSLVVNHVNIGVLCLFMFVFMFMEKLQI